MSPTRSGYKELGLELVSLEDNLSSFQAASHGEIKERQGSKISNQFFLVEVLTQQGV
jgi:hypothetical protein